MRRVMLLGWPLVNRMFVDCDEHTSTINLPFAVADACAAMRQLGLPPGNPVILEAIFEDYGKTTATSPPMRIFEYQRIDGDS